jgi:hypothetical protein
MLVDKDSHSDRTNDKKDVIGFVEAVGCGYIENYQ